MILKIHNTSDSSEAVAFDFEGTPLSGRDSIITNFRVLMESGIEWTNSMDNNAPVRQNTLSS